MSGLKRYSPSSFTPDSGRGLRHCCVEDEDGPYYLASDIDPILAERPRVWDADSIKDAPEEGEYLKRDFGVWRCIGPKSAALRYNTGTTDTYYGPIPPVPIPTPEAKG